MGQDPGAVRQDIEQTRERMGDTIEALGHKTDVPGRAKEAVSSRVGAVKSRWGAPRRTAATSSKERARRSGSPRRIPSVWQSGRRLSASSPAY